MTLVEGQIEPLEKIREILNQNGITRFNSIGEISGFLKNYNFEKNKISEDIEHALDLETKELQFELIEKEQSHDNLKKEITRKLNVKVKNIKDKFSLVEKKSEINLINKFFYFPQLSILRLKKSNLENKFQSTINKKLYVIENEINKLKEKLEYYLENKEKIILGRGLQDTKELAFTKEVVEELYNLIAGAVGENLVVKEIQKLPDEYFLFNNFSMEFNPPIFNRKENDRIYSIQIDHLLVSNSGIFILETKNWSKESIKNLDLRSPIKQITRTSYALFVLLNSESEYDDINLHDHHWGNKQIPIRNIIVMINEKPNEKFKYVKVKTLNELNGYVTYFEPIFNNAEVESISNYLRSNMQDHNDDNNLVL